MFCFVDAVIIDYHILQPDELFCVEHLKDTETLADELIEKIKLLKNSPEELEEVYKVVNAMMSES